MNNKTTIIVLKYALYSILLILLYAIQTMPGLTQINGVRPMWVIPAAMAMAMHEGEVAGGVLGAVAGLFCDMSGNSLFGYNGFMVSACCAMGGLLILFLMRNNVFSCVLFVSFTVMVRGSVEFLFAYGMWGYDNVSKIYYATTLPSAIYTVAVSPLVFLLVRKIYDIFEEKLAS